MNINVISSDLDGRQLRLEKAKNTWHTRADGKHDETAIMEADKRASSGSKSWAFTEEQWDKIFRK
jgi:hypothetical protein